MTKRQTVFYSIAFWAVIIGALVVDGAPRLALATIVVSGLSIWLAERG